MERKHDRAGGDSNAASGGRDVGHGDERVVQIRRLDEFRGDCRKRHEELVGPERVVAELLGEPGKPQHAAEIHRADQVLPSLAAVWQTGAELHWHSVLARGQAEPARSILIRFSPSSWVRASTARKACRFSMTFATRVV